MRVIELAGIDGVGKTTQAQLLTQRLGELGFSAQLLPARQLSVQAAAAWEEFQRTGDPGVSLESLAVSGAASFMLQSDLLDRTSGNVVFVADRYLLSAYAYNAVRGVDMAFVHSCFARVVEPVCGVLLVLPPEIARGRLEWRGRPLDFEERSIERQSALQREFLRIVPSSWTILDATRGVEVLARDVLESVLICSDRF